MDYEEAETVVKIITNKLDFLLEKDHSTNARKLSTADVIRRNGLHGSHAHNIEVDKKTFQLRFFFESHLFILLP